MKNYSGKLQIRTNAKNHADIAKISFESGISINKLLNEIIENYLERKNKNNLEVNNGKTY